jgi:hypothetical protein
MRRPLRCWSLPLAVVFLVVPLFAASNPVPYLNQPPVPSSAQPGSGPLTLRVNGTGFVLGAVVKWNGTPLTTTFITRNRLRAVVPASRITKPVTASITVSNPAPGGGASNPAFFTVTNPSTSLTFSTSGLQIGNSIAAVAVGDFDNNGKLDMAVVNQGASYTCNGSSESGYVSILLGKGDGTFTPGGNIELGCIGLGALGVAVTVADFNHDGRADLAVTFDDIEGRGLAIYLGNGDGSFSTLPSDTLGSWDGAGTVLAGDFNADGKLDLALPVDVQGVVGLWVFLGNGNGTFASTPVTSYEGIWSNADDRWIVEGDFNNDGILDIAADNFTSQPVEILLGTGNGTFSPAPSQPAMTAVSPQSAALVDFNGDGILDLALSDSGSTSLTVLLGHNDGTFTQQAVEPDAGQTTTYIASADFNGDGKPDLALVDSANSILIYLGNGDGTFQTGLETAVESGPSELAIGDFTSDGRLDLAVDYSSSNAISLLLQAPAAAVSNSDLKFGKQTVGTTSPARHVSLSNTGSAALNLSGIISSGEFSATNNCKAVLPVGQACSISVVFKPAAQGITAGSITITDNASDSPQIIQLSGTGD